MYCSGCVSCRWCRTEKPRRRCCAWRVCSRCPTASTELSITSTDWSKNETLLQPFFLCLSLTQSLTHTTQELLPCWSERARAHHVLCPQGPGMWRFSPRAAALNSSEKNLTLSDKLITLKRLCLCAYKPSASLAHSWTMPLTTTFCLKCCVFSRSAQVQGVTVKRRYVLLLFHLIPISFFFLMSLKNIVYFLVQEKCTLYSKQISVMSYFVPEINHSPV